MSRFRIILVFAVLLTIGLFCLNLNGCGGTSSGSHAVQKIQHVVVIFQENRTPDNLFHGLPNADIATSGVNSHGQTITLTQTDLVPPFDLNHRHADFVSMYDGGKMDGADLIPVVCPAGTTNCAPPNPQFTYVDPSQVQPYFALAQQYTFGDRMFQTNQGPSFPAHQFLISGTSAPAADSNLFAAENLDQAAPNAGCIAAPNITVALIDPQGNESQHTYPCYEHPTLTDLMNKKGISWKYYAPSPGSIWTAPNAIQHMCGPDLPPPNGTKCQGSDWVNNVSLQTKQNRRPSLPTSARGTFRLWHG